MGLPIIYKIVYYCFCVQICYNFATYAHGKLAEHNYLFIIAVFAFGNSCNHRMMAEDALVARRMNLKSGKTPLTRNGVKPDGSIRGVVYLRP